MVRRKELNFIRIFSQTPLLESGEGTEPAPHLLRGVRTGVRAVGGILELELPPLADAHAQGGGEAFVARPALVGDKADELVVGLIMRGT